MKRLLERAEKAARAKQRRTIGVIAGRLREQLSGTVVEEQINAVLLKGRQLTQRWLNELALRFIAAGRA